MGLLQPDSGLIFWMTLAFLVVLFVVGKFGFPIIIRSIEERKAYIDHSLQSAAEAEERLTALKEEEQRLADSSEATRMEILRRATAEGEEIIRQARFAAEEQGAELLRQARLSAEQEREQLLKDAQRQVALLAVAISEQMLKTELSDPEKQGATVARLLQEMENQKGISNA